MSVPMKKNPKAADEFFAIVNLDPFDKVFFKYVVDGVWRCSGEFPTEGDQNGNVNNWRVPSQEPLYQQVSPEDANVPLKATLATSSAKNPEKIRNVIIPETKGATAKQR
jgi:hypothetical protein